jgi:uncharacterized membrane protein YqjE
MNARDTNHPLTSVLTRIVSDLAYLVQTEIRLARAELGEKVSQAASGGTLIGVAAVLFLPGLFLLLLCLVAWLARAGLPERWGLLLVGGIVVLAAAALVLKCIRNLTQPTLLPTRTIDQVKADISVAKEHV